MMMMKILSVDNQSYLKFSLFKNKKKVIVIRSRAFLSSKGIDTESTTLTPRSRRRNAGNAWPGIRTLKSVDPTWCGSLTPRLSLFSQLPSCVCIVSQFDCICFWYVCTVWLYLFLVCLYNGSAWNNLLLCLIELHWFSWGSIWTSWWGSWRALMNATNASSENFFQRNAICQMVIIKEANHQVIYSISK